MSDAPKIASALFIAFTAIGIAYAVWISLRRPPLADPFFHPFGDMPGFTDRQLLEISAGAMRNAARDPLRRSFATRHPAAGAFAASVQHRALYERTIPSAGLALRPDAGSDGRFVPSCSAAARIKWWRSRRVAS